MTLAVHFYAVEGENLNADGGFIEVSNDGLVSVSSDLDWVVDLQAWVEPRNPKSAATRPVGGFEKVGEDGDRVIFKPVGTWDAAVWIDKVRYHFRTPYLRPGEVEKS